MARKVRLTAVQPPSPDDKIRNADMLESAIQLTDEAGKISSDIVLLPELINLYEVIEFALEVVASPDRIRLLFDEFSKLAEKHHMYIILPVGELRPDNCLYNSAILIGRDGTEIGRYDKVHISQPEYLLYPNIKGGTEFPTFDLDFGRVAIMTCYDCNFPEVAIIYALKGTDVVFYPRWQSGPSEIFFDIQMRSRALDNAMYVVSSSFGVRDGVPWKPGMLFGRSCVIGRDGTILSEAGHEVGLATTVVDLDQPRLIECLDASHGEGLIKEYRELIHQDRRPDLYRLICGLDE